MDDDLFDLAIRPSDTEDEKTRREEERIKKRWLWIIGAVGFLLLGVCPPFTLFWTTDYGAGIVHTIDNNWPDPSLFTLDMTVGDLFKALGIYTALALGPTLSAVWLWHRIAHKAKKLDWKQGTKAGILANLLAYPLAGLMVLWCTLLMNFSHQPGRENLISFFLNLMAASIMGPYMGVIVLLYDGWWTAAVSLLLGALCGWLEGWELKRNRGEMGRRDTLKY